MGSMRDIAARRLANARTMQEYASALRALEAANAAAERADALDFAEIARTGRVVPGFRVVRNFD